MKEIRITTEDFFIGNFGIPAPTDEIIEACTQNLNVDEKGISKRDEEAGVGDEDTTDYKIRECYVSWLDVKNINFIEHEVDCPVKIVSVGPQRHETITR